MVKVNFGKITGLMYGAMSSIDIPLGLAFKEVRILIGVGAALGIAAYGIWKKRWWGLIIASIYEIWMIPTSWQAVSLRLEREYLWTTLKDVNQILDLVTLGMAIMLAILWKDLIAQKIQKGISSV